MGFTNNKGTNYGNTINNVDENGIHFGIIPAHHVGQAWYDSTEMDYGKPCCPKCGNEVKELSCDEITNIEDKKGITIDGEFYCEGCNYSFESDEAYGDEGTPYIKDEEYHAWEDEYGDIWVSKSPYYTYAQFCSPCAPNACYLCNPLIEKDENNKVYCLGKDFFEDNDCPYPIYEVSTNKLIYEPIKKETGEE